MQGQSRPLSASRTDCSKLRTCNRSFRYRINSVIHSRGCHLSCKHSRTPWSDFQFPTSQKEAAARSKRNHCTGRLPFVDQAGAKELGQPMVRCEIPCSELHLASQERTWEECPSFSRSALESNTSDQVHRYGSCILRLFPACEVMAIRSGRQSQAEASLAGSRIHHM